VYRDSEYPRRFKPHGAGAQVTAPARGERSFHVFYMLLRGLAMTAPATAAALRLRGPVEYRYLGGVSAGEMPNAAAREAMEASSEAATAHEGGRTDAEQVEPAGLRFLCSEPIFGVKSARPQSVIESSCPSGIQNPCNLHNPHGRCPLSLLS
jgi:hypothetical protein